MAEIFVEIPNPYSAGGFPKFREVPPIADSPNPYIVTDPVTGEKVVQMPGNVFLPGIVETVRKAEKRGSVPHKLSEDVLKQIEANMNDEIWVFKDLTPDEAAEKGAKDIFTSVPEIANHPERLARARTAFVKAVERDPLKYVRPNLARRVREAAIAGLVNGDKEFHVKLYQNLPDLFQAMRDEIVAANPGQAWAPIVGDLAKNAANVAHDMLLGNKVSFGEALANHRYAIVGGVLVPGFNQLLTESKIYETLDNILPGASKGLSKIISDVLRGLANKLLKEKPVERLSDLLVGGLFDGPGYIEDDPDKYFADVFSRASGTYNSEELKAGFIGALQQLRTQMQQGSSDADSVLAVVKNKISIKVHRDDGELRYEILKPYRLDAVNDKARLKDAKEKAGKYRTLAELGKTPTMTWTTKSGTVMPFALLPARRSYGVGANGPQAPGVGAGLSFRTIMNIVALNIPGRAPELQPFGVKGEYIEYVAAFIGYDPEAEKIAETMNIKGNMVKLREMGLAWDESERAAEIVRRGEDVTLTIMTGAMHIKETGKIEEMERIGVRDDLVWYKIRFRVKSKLPECPDPKASARTDGYEVIDIGNSSNAVKKADPVKSDIEMAPSTAAQWDQEKIHRQQTGFPQSATPDPTSQGNQKLIAMRAKYGRVLAQFNLRQRHLQDQIQLFSLYKTSREAQIKVERYQENNPKVKDQANVAQLTSRQRTDWVNLNKAAVQAWKKVNVFLKDHPDLLYDTAMGEPNVPTPPTGTAMSAYIDQMAARMKYPIKRNQVTKSYVDGVIDGIGTVPDRANIIQRMRSLFQHAEATHRAILQYEAKRDLNAKITANDAYTAFKTYEANNRSLFIR